jgi:hypothetical protein
MRAEVFQNPVSEAVLSLEVRWIFPGQLETAVARWFARFPATTESREDSYLLDPHLPGLSVKVRAGRALEVKVYRGSPGTLQVPGRARTGCPGRSPPSARSPRIRWTGWTGGRRPPPLAPSGNYPATTTQPTRSGPNPPRPRRTFGPPGTRLLPPSARPAGRTSAACPTAGYCTCATPTLSKPPGHPGTWVTSCARSAPPPGTLTWPLCAPARKRKSGLVRMFRSH